MTMERPHAAAFPSNRLILGDARFRYYPLWDVWNDCVLCYLCETFWDGGSGHSLLEDDLSSEFDDNERRLALDLEILHQGLAEAEQAASHYGVMKVLVPVHFSTLADPETAGVYVEECNKRVWPVYDEVAFEIVYTPHWAHAGQLTGVAETISSFGQALFLRVDTDFDDFAAVAPKAFASVGVNLRVDPRTEDDLVGEIIAFAGKAKAAGLRCHAHGLESVVVSAAAVSSGFDFIGSDAIAPALEFDHRERDVPRSLDLLRTMLASRKTI